MENDFISNINVEKTIKNKMYGFIVAKAVDTKDLNFEIEIKQLNDLKSNINVQNTNIINFKSNIIIQQNNLSDLKINVNIKQFNDIHSNIRISAKNRMFGFIEAQAPPIINKKIAPKKDCYISSLYHTFNYGTQKGIIIGNYKGETYRAFQQIDLSNFKTCVITKAKLILNLQRSADTSIRLSTFKDNWIEQNMTWKNQPSTVGSLSLTGVKRTDKQLSIDILNNVQNNFAVKNYVFNFRFATANNIDNQYICINSRENVEPSYLEIEYYDTRIRQYDQLPLPSKIVVQRSDLIQIPSTININRYNDSSDLELNVTVRRGEILDSNIKITRNFISSNVNIKKYYNSDVDSKIQIRKYGSNEMENYIIVSRNFMNCDINIMQLSDINSAITIRRTANNNVDSNVAIRRTETNEFKSKMIVMYKDQIDSKLTIRNTENSDIINNIVVRQTKENGLVSKTLIVYINDIKSNISIRNSNESILTSNTTIRQNKFITLPSQTFIKNHSSVPSIIVVSKNLIESAIVVRRTDNNDLIGNIKVRNTNSENVTSNVRISNPVIKSNMIVKQTQSNDINGNIVVSPARSLSGNIIITTTNNIQSDISIRVNFFNDIKSKMNVEYKSDITGHVFIIGKGKSTLVSKIAVPTKEQEDFEGNIVISPAKSLNGNIIITRVNDVKSEISIRVNFFDDIKSKMNVEFKNDIAGHVFIIGKGKEDLRSTVCIENDESYVFIM